MSQQVAVRPLTQCYLCWKDYKNPQKLSCGHMFCCQCLHNVIVSLAQQSINIKVNCVLECPLCYLPTENSNQASQIGSATMKNLPLIAEESKGSAEPQKHVPIVNQKTNVDDWFGKSTNSNNEVKFSGINVKMCFQAYESSTKYDRLPIGWTLSSQKGGAIQVPRKLYNDFSKSFFSPQDVSPIGMTNGLECAEGNNLVEEENDLREQQFLNSLELAEIQFLQPDSLRGESQSKKRLDEKVNGKVKQNNEPTRNGDLSQSNSELDILIGATDSPNLNQPKKKNEIPKKTPKEGTLTTESLHTPNSKNFNNLSGFCIQNSKYKEINSISTAIFNKNSRYNQKNIKYVSLKTLTSGRSQFSGKRPPVSTCKFHPKQIASLYCTSCQIQTCNVCFFDRHQHCTVQMSKEATLSLTKYLQEKLFQAKMLKAQLESWVSMFEGEITRVSQQADEMINYMTEMLKEKRKMIIREIEKIRESPSVRRMQESFFECVELEDRLRVYLQELRWSSPDNCLVQPFLQSNVPSLHMPTSAELNTICMLRPILQPNAFMVRTFLEMQNHSLGNIKLQSPVGTVGVEMKIATGSCLNGQKLSHKMENILEKCLQSLPLKLCVFGTIKGNEVAQHDAVDSIVLLPNKCTLLSDPSNMKVKMLSFQGERLGEVGFESSPNALCLCKPHVAAVTVSNLKKIYFLNCENILSIRSAVSTKKGYWGLAAGEIERVDCLLGVASHSSSVDVLKYNKSMSNFTILKVISISKLEIWGDICHLCFTKSCIVVADCFGSRVISVNLEGKVLFEFPGQKDGLLKCPADVTADEQYIYVSDIGNNRILRLGHDGVFSGVILTAQDGLLRPKAIDIDELGHLAISQFTEWPALLIFKTRF